jgi:hypothetical protein
MTEALRDSFIYAESANRAGGLVYRCGSCGALDRSTVAFQIRGVLSRHSGQLSEIQGFGPGFYARVCDLCVEEARAGLALFLG